MTTELSWHVQKFVAIWWTLVELQSDEILVKFVYMNIQDINPQVVDEIYTF